MNNDKLFQACVEAAVLIVAAEKAEWPGCEKATNTNLNFGGGSSEQQTSFARQGTSGNTIQYGLPSFLTDLITGNASSMPSDPALAAQQTALFSSLLGKSVNAMPGANVLSSNMDITPTSFMGASSLEKIAARDPYSTQFENDTQAAYEQRGKDAMAQVATGPDAVRGGNARTGIAQGVMGERLAQGRGQEVRAAQTQDAGIVQGADQLFNAIETARRGVAMGAQGQKAGQVLQQDQNALGAARALDTRKVSNLAALQMASDLLGTKKGLTTENLTGAGNQTNSNFDWGTGINI